MARTASESPTNALDVDIAFDDSLQQLQDQLGRLFVGDGEPAMPRAAFVAWPHDSDYDCKNFKPPAWIDKILNESIRDCGRQVKVWLELKTKLEADISTQSVVPTLFGLNCHSG